MSTPTVSHLEESNLPVRSQESSQILDLPDELLHLISNELDDESICRISITCRRFHYLALPILFERHDEYYHQEGFLVSYQGKKETVPALKMALFVTQLQEIHFYLNHTVERLFSELNHLRGLVSRLTSLKTAMISFSDVDVWLQEVLSDNGEESTLPTRPMIEVERWKEAFLGLMDAFLRASCTRLSIQGGRRIFEVSQAMASDSIPAIPSPYDQLSMESLSLYPPAATFQEEINTSMPWDTSNKLNQASSFYYERTRDRAMTSALVNFEIFSEILLEPLCFSWTLDALNASANTLTHLAFKVENIPSTTWSHLFGSLSLNALESLNITCGLVIQEPHITTESFFEFLARHPTVTTLDLYGVSILEEGFLLPKGILPNITTITAHPSYIVGIVRQQCDKSTPSLKSITVSSEYYTHRSFDYRLFDDALVSVTQLATDIELGLKFAYEIGLDQWFLTHSSSTNPSIIRNLHHVQKLTIKVSWFIELSSTVFQIFPIWLSLFRNLSYLEFAELPSESVERFTSMDNKHLLEEIAFRCPRLESITLNHRTKLHMSSFRK
ncbi:hypothetical protein BDQ12DRAFT_728710 [Crucibulum laeve]|uniref:F-box domain-containing protein n=1 Tax=Crucibulum laeve TaxID=68775 RepID=A0A5C3LIG9_9AGAR|nr:hypothetical protein BDQ12DRAFT_728710 [Crucibulum laeve]